MKTAELCFLAVLFCANLRIQRDKEKDHLLKLFPTDNAEKRGAFDACYSILRHSAKSAGQKISVYAKVFRRKRS